MLSSPPGWATPKSEVAGGSCQHEPWLVASCYQWLILGAKDVDHLMLIGCSYPRSCSIPATPATAVMRFAAIQQRWRAPRMMWRKSSSNWWWKSASGTLSGTCQDEGLAQMDIRGPCARYGEASWFEQMWIVRRETVFVLTSSDTSCNFSE